MQGFEQTAKAMPSAPQRDNREEARQERKQADCRGISTTDYVAGLC